MECDAMEVFFHVDRFGRSVFRGSAQYTDQKAFAWFLNRVRLHQKFVE